MNTGVLLTEALSSLRKNARRSILTMLGIIIGIAAVITIISLGKGFQRQAVQSLTNNKTGAVPIQFYFTPTSPTLDMSKLSPFSEGDFSAIEKIKGVEKAEFKKPNDDGQFYQNIEGRNANKEGVISRVEEFDESQVVEGRSLTSTDNEAYRRVALISTELAEKMYGSSSNSLNHAVAIGDVQFTIVGTFRHKDQSISISFSDKKPDANTGDAIIPDRSYFRYYPQDNNRLNLTVYVKKSYDSKTVADDVQTYLNAQGSCRQLGKYEYFDMSEVMNEIGKTLDMATYFVSAVAGISLLIAGVGVMNMMYISVSERTKEIGIRRALGATASDIQKQFLIEGIVLTFIGGVIGYILGVLCAYLISLALPFNIYLDFFSISLAIGVSVLIGIAFSVFPAKSAAAKNVIDILR